MNDLSKNYINGQWQNWNGETIDVHEAATGDVIAKVPASGREEMEKAIAAASTAFESWSESTLEKRLHVLEQLHAGLKERAGEIAETVCREVGMPIKLATGIQAGLPATITKSYLKMLPEFTFAEQVGNSEVQYTPLPPVARWCSSRLKSPPKVPISWRIFWTRQTCPRVFSTWSAAKATPWATP